MEKVQISKSEMLAVLRATQFITEKKIIKLDEKEQEHLLNFTKRLINTTGYIGLVYREG